MNSGLYALAGDSATATEAACANRFDEPMTNVSNVYFGLSRLPSPVPPVRRSPPGATVTRCGIGGGGAGTGGGGGLDDRPCLGQSQVRPRLGGVDPVRQVFGRRRPHRAEVEAVWHPVTPIARRVPVAPRPARLCTARPHQPAVIHRLSTACVRA